MAPLAVQCARVVAWHWFLILIVERKASCCLDSPRYRCPVVAMFVSVLAAAAGAEVSTQAHIRPRNRGTDCCCCCCCQELPGYESLLLSFCAK